MDIAATYKFSKNYALTFAVNNLFDVNFWEYAQSSVTNNQGVTTILAQNRYQRILPSRNYWISFGVVW